jgi:2-polyprenyl-3-methyl-5-hydroxy-6-metoxy-1,4-benzoquinol methylase
MTMNLKTCALLADLNRAFYATFAGDFARTRRGWPPGFDLILSYLAPGANVLDLGCGNGRFLDFLAARGWHGSYLGVDNDPQLLNLANAAASCSPAVEAAFLQVDLLDPAWAASLAGRRPDRIVCLAVLHHIPGRGNRERFVAGCAALLPPGGLLILSTWQFLGADRLRARILPWTTIGLSSEDVEPGDYLLAWGEGAMGHRYCASINQADLCALASEVGLARTEAFHADGKEGNLNLYGIFVKREA